jgi:hypothetical protein
MEEIMDNEIKDALFKVRSKIEQGWTRKTFARNFEGMPVSLCSSDACEFCLVGAIFKVTALSKFGLLSDVMGAVGAACGHGSLIIWNDSPNRTKEEVLAVVDKAIVNA